MFKACHVGLSLKRSKRFCIRFLKTRSYTRLFLVCVCVFVYIKKQIKDFPVLVYKCQFWQHRLKYIKFESGWSEWVQVSASYSVVSDFFWPHGLYSPWNSPGQNTGAGSLFLLQGIFPTQGPNPSLLHCRQILYQLSCEGSPESVWTLSNRCLLKKERWFLSRQKTRTTKL